MFKKLFGFMLSMLLSIRGEEAVSEPAAEVDTGDAPDEGQAQPPTEPAGEAKSATPKYGTFGDNPSVDDMYKNYEKVNNDFNNFKQKATLTERNLAAVRQSIGAVAEKLQAKPVFDQRGVLLGFEPIQAAQKPARQPRFNDEVKAKLTPFFSDPKAADEFTGIIRNLIQDEAESIAEKMFQEGFEPRFKDTFSKITTERSNKSRQATESMAKAAKLFPGVIRTLPDGSDNPNFNEALHTRATEIWENNPEYKNSPRGQLDAIIDAGAELGVPAATIVETAKKEGFEAGKQSKKVLGPVVTGKSRPGGVGKVHLEPEEFNRLTPDEKLAYQKASVNL